MGECIVAYNSSATTLQRYCGTEQVAALQGILQQLQLVNTRLNAIEQSLPQAQPHAPAATVEPRLLEALAKHSVDDETIVGTLAKSGCKTLKDLIMMDKEDIDDLELPRLVSKKLKMCKAEEEFDEFQEENRKIMELGV